MNSALVFGATSGIGKCIAESLAGQYRVKGIGRDISKASIQGVELIECDLQDEAQERKLLDSIECPDVIIFSAGSAYYGLHENIDGKAIEEMVNVDLLSPMRVANHYLNRMKQRKSGHLIFISSVTSDSVNPHGACYGACKAGLRSFARSLFEEVRKHDIKITLITPDLTDTALYRNANFGVDKDLVLKPQDVAEAVTFALNKPGNVDVFEISVRPMRNAIIK